MCNLQDSSFNFFELTESEALKLQEKRKNVTKLVTPFYSISFKVEPFVDSLSYEAEHECN